MEGERPDRRLGVHFPGWRRQEPAVIRQAYTTGLIVVDANVLLALYEITADAREEVLAVLQNVRARVWVPQQAMLEYCRNRRRVVQDRINRFSAARRGVQLAERDLAV